MNYISIKYTLKYRLSFAHNYQWDDKGNCFNIETGRKLKQSYNCGSIGYSINGKFRSLKYLRKYIELIPITKLPF